MIIPDSICSYSHYIFSLLDQNSAGSVTFEVMTAGTFSTAWTSFLSQEFVLTLSPLVRGTDEDRFNWTFSLYDTNGDGFISKEEMEDVAQSVSKITVTV